MIAATAKFVLVIAAYILAVMHANVIADVLEQVTAAVVENPVGGVQIFAFAGLVIAMFRYIGKLTRPRPRYVAVAAGAARASLARPDSACTLGGSARRARHEAAHAVVAVALGASNVSADIVYRGASGGQTRFTSPEKPLVDSVFDELAICHAGNIVDVRNGHHDDGSRGDVRGMYERAIVILSAGVEPSAHTGDLTLDALLRTSRGLAAGLIDEHAAAVDAITAHLMENRRIADDEIRAFCGIDAVVDVERSEVVAGDA